jgi:hypothetical protein
MYATLENITELEIDKDGIHLLELRNHKIVDKITLESFDYDTEELAIELIEMLTHKLYQYKRETKTESKAKEVIKYVLEHVAEEALNNEIKEWKHE